MEIFNWWAILVATILAFVLGGLWYGPVFGKAWIAAMGKTEEDIEPTPAPFIISFFTALLTAVALAYLIQGLGITTTTGGALLGTLVGFGFIATAMASDTAFCGWGMRLFLIQSGYRVVYSIIMGALLGGWQ
ncbi:MAG: DUF1761 domain-containing protein [Pseudomonadota bacterium]